MSTRKALTGTVQKNTILITFDISYDIDFKPRTYTPYVKKHMLTKAIF